MPCNSGHTYSDGVNEYLGKLNELTRFTCGLIKRLEEKNLLKYVQLDPELWAWWQDHQEADRLRLEGDRKIEAQRQARREALSKLTYAERELLGVQDIFDDAD